MRILGSLPLLSVLCQTVALFAAPAAAQTSTGLDLFNDPNVTFPSRAPSTAGTALVYGPGVAFDEVLFRKPLVAAGSIANSAGATTIAFTVDLTRVANQVGPEDHDPHFLVTDGTTAIGFFGGDFGVTGASSGTRRGVSASDSGTVLTNVSYTDPADVVANGTPAIGGSYQLCAVVTLTESTSSVQVEGVSQSYDYGFGLNRSAGLSLLFVGNSPGEQYQLNTLHVGVTCGDLPPTADAGPDQSVNEGQTGVMLDGSGSGDPDNDPLTYAWSQIAGTSVALSDPTVAQPTFDAPLVAIGGEVLTFELTVTANGQSDQDTVDVTVVNVNHPPVADAGDDQSIAEGSPVTLDGSGSFDVDGDPFTYSWVQVSGSPTVTLTGANTVNPTFTAPFAGAGGAPGVVATLVFELTVDDGFPQDEPTPGYTFANVVDSVTIDVTNLNNDPTADAGNDQTVNENSPVSLDGSGSSDPDSDPLTYTWSQTGGSPVALAGAGTATPSFTAPFTSPGGEAFTFQLTVDDGFGGTATDDVVVNVQNINDPPDASLAQPTTACLWPPNHKLVSIGITGVTDPNSNATITIDAVFQDEPTQGTGSGDTPVDAFIQSDGTVLLRAERSGNGDGRVYHIHFTASDLEGSDSGVVTVCVPHSKKKVAVDGGPLHDSTQ